jgi:hypothetical protein
MSSLVTSNTEAAILARIIEFDAAAITLDVARYLLSMQLTSADKERVNQLSAKAGAGSLNQREAQELDSYLHIGRLLADHIVAEKHGGQTVENNVALACPHFIG